MASLALGSSWSRPTGSFGPTDLRAKCSRGRTSYARKVTTSPRAAKPCSTSGPRTSWPACSVVLADRTPFAASSASAESRRSVCSPQPERLLFVDRREGRFRGPRRRADVALVVSLDDDLQLLVGRQPGASRDEAAHDDVFLEPAQVVDLAGNRGFREHLRGLLERARADEGLGRKAGLGDAEK